MKTSPNASELGDETLSQSMTRYETTGEDHPTCVLMRPRKISESIYHSENGTSLGWTDEQELTMTLLKSFLADENGATAIEYCLIATGIAFAIIAAVNNTGSALLSGKFNSISAAMK